MTDNTPDPAEAWTALALAADTPDELEAGTQRLAQLLTASPPLTLAEAMAQLPKPQPCQRHRRIVVCAGAEDARAALARRHSRQVKTAQLPEGAPEPQVAFMFPGGGAQHAGMARQVYAQQATFAAAVDECAKLFAAQLGLDVRDAITVEPGSGSVAAMVEQPQLGLTSLFTVEYALAQLWLARGISPAILIGHSLGEYVAATLAGVLSLADAVRLVALRARLLQRLPAGVMLTVGASEHELLPLLPPGVSVAALNGPTQTVVSGSEQLIGQLESVLAERDVTVRRLRIVAGGHSSMVDSILAEFSAALADVVTRPPRIPCVSNLTGDLLTDEQATDPSYWVRHLRAPVRFTDGISTVLARSPVSLLEVGPGTTLSTLALQNGAAPPPIASLRHPLDPRSDAAMLATAVGELWLNGVRVDPHMINTA